MPPAAPGLALPELLAGAPALAAALPGVERAAATDLPVLLLGEPGSGRSTLARALHAAGPRAAGPLVEVDPGAFPSALFESELFGYRPGAFTGADRESEGRVARAAGGTLVLDHVEELPLAAQPKLLRLLAERRYAPLGGREAGGGRALRGDRRRGPAGARRARALPRRPLLSPGGAGLPPAAAARAAGRTCRRSPSASSPTSASGCGRPAPRLAAGALDWMLAHPWPGNVRQLRNVLERGLVMAAGAEVDPPRPEGWEGERPRRLAAVEEAEIRRALAYTRGHQGRAAELLGISRKSLWERRRRLGIP